MTDKERLENMSPIGFDLNGNILLKSEDYHWLMEQAGLTKNNIKYASDVPLWIYSQLTWEGHDFLDSIKNDTIWNKTKESIKSKGLELGQVSFSVLKDFAVLKAKEKLGII